MRRIAAIQKYMATLEYSPAISEVKATMTPIKRPPTIAPPRLPRPPTTVTTNATIVISTPISGVADIMGTEIAPANAARPMPMPKPVVQMRGGICSQDLYHQAVAGCGSHDHAKVALL